MPRRRRTTKRSARTYDEDILRWVTIDERPIPIRKRRGRRGQAADYDEDIVRWVTIGGQPIPIRRKKGRRGFRRYSNRANYRPVDYSQVLSINGRVLPAYEPYSGRSNTLVHQLYYDLSSDSGYEEEDYGPEEASGDFGEELEEAAENREYTKFGGRRKFMYTSSEDEQVEATKFGSTRRFMYTSSEDEDSNNEDESESEDAADNRKAVRRYKDLRYGFGLRPRLLVCDSDEESKGKKDGVLKSKRVTTWRLNNL